MSAIRYATDKGLKNKLTLISSNRTLAGTAFYNELNGLARSNDNLKTIFSVTDDAAAKNIPGLICTRLDCFLLKDIVGATLGKTFFLCGPPVFMAAMKKNLLEIGVDEDDILMEEFAMISDKAFVWKLKHLTSIAGYSLAALALPFYLIHLANGKAGQNILPLDTAPSNTGTLVTESSEPIEPNPDLKADLSGDVVDSQAVAIIEKIVQPKYIPANSQTGTVSSAGSKSVTNPVAKINANTVSNTNKVAAPVVTPKPITASSIPANTTVNPTTNSATTPTPTTGASTAAGGTSATAPTTNTPTPTTGASTAAGTTVTTGGATTGTTNTTRRENDDD
jgi:hypothetical protein